MVIETLIATAVLGRAHILNKEIQNELAPAVVPGTVIYESKTEDGKVYFFTLPDRFEQVPCQLREEIDFKSSNGESIFITFTNKPGKGMKDLWPKVLSETPLSRRFVTLEGAVVILLKVGLFNQGQKYDSSGGWYWKNCFGSVDIKGDTSQSELYKNAKGEVTGILTSFFFHENPEKTVSLIKKRGGKLVVVKPYQGN